MVVIDASAPFLWVCTLMPDRSSYCGTMVHWSVLGTSTVYWRVSGLKCCISWPFTLMPVRRPPGWLGGDVDDRDYMLDEVSETPRGNDVDGVSVGHALGFRRGDDGHLSCFGLVGEYAAIRDGVLSLSTVTYLPSASTYPCACRSVSCSYSVCVPP